MARADRRRVRSARPHAASARPRSASDAAIEDTMFFPRLRRHAKWMFVFLALVFGVGFVVFGIGAEPGRQPRRPPPRRRRRHRRQLSVSDAREQVQKNPKNADAQRELATALQEDGQHRRGDRRR